MPTPIPIHAGGSSTANGNASPHARDTEGHYPNMTDGRRGSLFGTSLTTPMSFGAGNSFTGNPGSFAPMSLSNNSYNRSSFAGPQSFRFYAAGTSASSWRGHPTGFGGSGMSFTRDSMMDYDNSLNAKLGTSAGSDHGTGTGYGLGLAPGSLRTSSTYLQQQHQLESTFCRNFTCCGLDLADLHDLLQHYEEQHVRLDDLDDQPLPGMVNDDGSSEQSSNASSQLPHTPAVAGAGQGGRNANGPRDRPLSANAAALAAVNQRKRALNAFHPTPGTPGSSLASLSPAGPSGQTGQTPGIGNAGNSGLGGLQGPLRHFATPRRAGSPFASAGPGPGPGGAAGAGASAGGGNTGAGSEHAASHHGPLGLGGGGADPLLMGPHSATAGMGALSLRSHQQDDHGLPSCAPPNLFFPASGPAAQAANAAVGQGTSTGGRSSFLGNSKNGPPTSPSSPAAASTSATTVTGTAGATPLPPGSARPTQGRDPSPGAASAAGMKFDTKAVMATPGNVDKPFKCPSPGCDKAYKQMNGLKYHRVHGHCNQNLLVPPGGANPQPSGPSGSAGLPPTHPFPPRGNPPLGTFNRVGTPLASPHEGVSPTSTPVLSSASAQGSPALSGRAPAAPTPGVHTPSTPRSIAPTAWQGGYFGTPGATGPGAGPSAGAAAGAAASPFRSTFPTSSSSAAPTSTPTPAAPVASVPPEGNAPPGSNGPALASAQPGGSTDSSQHVSARPVFSTPSWASAGPRPFGTPHAALPGPSSAASLAGSAGGIYVCQVGTCGKTYKNLNGLRYHYLHSGSHGLLGLQILHAHGGGPSAKMGSDGKAIVSTATLAPEEVARAARLAAEMQAKKAHVTQRTVEIIQAQALAGGGPGHNHKQAREMQAIVDADDADASGPAAAAAAAAGFALGQDPHAPSFPHHHHDDVALDVVDLPPPPDHDHDLPMDGMDTEL